MPFIPTENLLNHSDPLRNNRSMEADFRKAIEQNDNTFFNTTNYSIDHLKHSFCSAVDGRSIIDTALTLAIRHGHYDLAARFLRETNSDPSFFANTNPLFAISRSQCKDFQLFKEICNHYKNTPFINSRNEDGDTALHYAVKNLPLDFVKYLLDLGADIATYNKFTQTPLHMACDKDVDIEIFKLLLEYPAPISINTLALHYAKRVSVVAKAIMDKNDDAIELLLQKFRLLFTDYEIELMIINHTPIKYIAEALNKNKELMEINEICPSPSGTFLVVAVRSNNLAAVKMLIELQHANVNVINNGDNLFHVALNHSSNEELINYLIEAHACNACLDNTDKYGKTVFQLAAEKNCRPILIKLLDYRENVKNDPIKKKLDELNHQALEAQRIEEQLKKPKVEEEILAKLNSLAASLSSLTERQTKIENQQNKIQNLLEQLIDENKKEINQSIEKNKRITSSLFSSFKR